MRLHPDGQGRFQVLLLPLGKEGLNLLASHDFDSSPAHHPK
jgi:hypothetical protein